MSYSRISPPRRPWATHPAATIFTRSSDSGRPTRGRPKSIFSPWENASRGPLETVPLRHSFQDANYHDRIVNERKRASMASADAGPYAGTEPRENRDRPQREGKLAEPSRIVKRPKKLGRWWRFLRAEEDAGKERYGAHRASVRSRADPNPSQHGPKPVANRHLWLRCDAEKTAIDNTPLSGYDTAVCGVGGTAASEVPCDTSSRRFPAGRARDGGNQGRCRKF